jgi:hypothetical protein
MGCGCGRRAERLMLNRFGYRVDADRVEFRKINGSIFFSFGRGALQRWHFRYTIIAIMVWFLALFDKSSSSDANL